MEEVVRAFNWVIEKGWVRQSRDHALDFLNNHAIICRRCTGAPLNGLQLKLKRLSVCGQPTDIQRLFVISLRYSHILEAWTHWSSC